MNDERRRRSPRRKLNKEATVWLSRSRRLDTDGPVHVGPPVCVPSPAGEKRFFEPVAFRTDPVAFKCYTSEAASPPPARKDRWNHLLFDGQSWADVEG